MASRRVSPDFQRFPAELIQIVSSPDMRQETSRTSVGRFGSFVLLAIGLRSGTRTVRQP